MPCLLNDRKKGGCATCATQCPHRIALEGLSGEGGRVAAAGLPKDYRHLTLANTPTKGARPEVDRMLSAYVATFDRQFEAEGARIKSFYIWSVSPGTGKTSTASALMNEYVIANYLGSLKRGIQPLQRPAYFFDTNSFQKLYTGFTRQGIPKDIAEKNSRQYYTWMELARTTPFVVFDDLGVRSVTDGFRQDLHDIINHRDVNGLPSIFTSNVAITDLNEIFDARFYDRVRHEGAILHFDGESKRGRKK